MQIFQPRRPGDAPAGAGDRRPAEASDEPAGARPTPDDDEVVEGEIVDEGEAS